MQFNPAGEPMHTGTEMYKASFRIEGDDVDAGRYDVRGDYVQYTFRPSILHLIWTREVGGVWDPSPAHLGGSMISGSRVLKSGELSDSQAGCVEVWRRYPLPPRLTEYAASLPGLEMLVAVVTEHLPQ